MKPISTKYPPGTLLQNIDNPDIFRVCLGWHKLGNGEESKMIDTISPTRLRMGCTEKYLNSDYQIVQFAEPQEDP
ncbi:MAG: hypothetical protein E6R04_05610 [Spirochaetes bacterium]|nr:MAG: hypothetical protein E6R04_05610 [Spirochaetota bacterium]